jgi:uncharacterized protein
MKLSRYHVITEPFYDEIEEKTKRVVFATRTANTRVIDDASWSILEDGKFEELPGDILSELTDIELIVPFDEDELRTVLTINNAAIIDDNDLSLVVQPTASCQLGCHYCGQQHSIKLMSDEDQERFIERARNKLETNKFSSLSIGWFGAEPLLGLSVIRTLTPQLRSLAKKFGCTYNAIIVTNGLALTEEIAEELVNDLGIDSIEITLDGVAEFHDARRMQKNGAPTFDKIFANVVTLANRQDLDIRLSIRCNVDYQNHESVTLLLKELSTAGIQKKIMFYVAPIHSWGNDAHNLSLSKEEFAAWEITWFGKMVELGFNVGLIPGRKPLVCMAISPNAELVDAYGNIFNCTEVSYVPTYSKNNENEYAIDHLSGKQTVGLRNRLGNFNERVSQGEYQCSTCPMLPVCGGHCPKSWLEGIEPCPSTKYNIEDRLLLTYALARIEEENLVNA